MAESLKLTKLVPPASRTGPADDLAALAQASPLAAKYATRIDRESARERLAARAAAVAQGEPAAPAALAPTAEHKEAAKAAGGGVGAVGAFLRSWEGKQLQEQVVRGVFGPLRKQL